MADVALRLIEVEVVVLPDIRLFLMQDIQNIKVVSSAPNDHSKIASTRNR